MNYPKVSRSVRPVMSQLQTIDEGRNGTFGTHGICAGTFIE